MNQPEKDASKRMYMHRQVTSKIGGGITYHFADPIGYGSTPTIRALGGILLRAESDDLPTVLGCLILPTGLDVFAEFGFTCFSARSPRNLPVFALALSASRCWLTAYSSSHLVTLVL